MLVRPIFLFDIDRELKQTDAAAANLQISIQKDSRPSEFNRPLTSITLNLKRDFPVDRRRVSLLKLPTRVKNNVASQALCASSNCLYTKSKSRMLRPLKGEVGYELST